VERAADRRPLRVQPAIALTAEQWRSLQVLEDYDLTLVRDRLVRDAVMPSGWLGIAPGFVETLGKWLDLHMLIMQTGRERTAAEYRLSLEAANFALTRVIRTSS